MLEFQDKTHLSIQTPDTVATTPIKISSKLSGLEDFPPEPSQPQESLISLLPSVSDSPSLPSPTNTQIDTHTALPPTTSTGMQTSPLVKPKKGALTPKSQIPLASAAVDSNKIESGSQQTPTKQVGVFGISFRIKLLS